MRRHPVTPPRAAVSRSRRSRAARPTPRTTRCRASRAAADSGTMRRPPRPPASHPLRLCRTATNNLLALTPAHPPACRPACPHARPPARPPACPSTHPPACQSVDLPACLLARPLTCRPIASPPGSQPAYLVAYGSAVSPSPTAAANGDVLCGGGGEREGG
eukprot:241495-Chlamydomonas_euryale.AAC.2